MLRLNIGPDHLSREVLIAPDEIAHIVSLPGGSAQQWPDGSVAYEVKGCHIHMKDGTRYIVRESLDELKNLIANH